MSSFFGLDSTLIVQEEVGLGVLSRLWGMKLFSFGLFEALDAKHLSFYYSSYFKL